VLVRRLKTLFLFTFQAAMGFGLIIAVNLIARPFDAAVGINAVTITTAGVLGLPGIVGLYVVRIFF